jgi:hypothetical protein
MLRRLSLATVLSLLAAGSAAAQPLPGLSGGQTAAIIAAIIFVIFAAIGIYMIHAGIRSRRLAKAAETWPTTGGTVVASAVKEYKSYDRKQHRTNYTYAPEILYTYKIAGTDYQSSTVRFGELTRNSRNLADELVGKYKPGSVVAVRYDPQDPARATLETQSAGGRQILTGAVFIAVPLFIAAVGGILLASGADKPNLPLEAQEQINPAGAN